MATIVLAEDHVIFRQGLKSLLQQKSDLSVVAETGDGLEAVALVRREKPDVLVVDLSLPGLDGLEVTRRVRQQSPHTRVVVLSMHASEAYVVQAVRNGALAYVLKNASMDDLEQAIRAVLEGRRFFSAALPQDLAETLAQADAEKIVDRYETLTKREREILQLVAEGYTSPEIAEKLFISLLTVNKHRSNLMDKLGRHSQTELVHYALQRGLIPLHVKPPERKEK